MYVCIFIYIYIYLSSPPNLTLAAAICLKQPLVACLCSASNPALCSKLDT